MSPTPVNLAPGVVASDPDSGADSALRPVPLDSLVELPGYQAIRQAWRASLDGQVRQLQAALANGKLAEAARLSHAMRGTGASFGYGELALVAAHIETAARAGDGALANAALARLLGLEELAPLKAAPTLPLR